jgi:hypothetical protein
MHTYETTFSLINFYQQISKTLAGADRKDLMRKLPKFIYDEEKALEVRSHPSLVDPIFPLSLTRMF